jgi:lipopolysaccharide biosynthesis protein
MNFLNEFGAAPGRSPAYDGLCELERIAPGSAPAVFREAARQGAVSAWWGHVPFAQWLMRVSRPRSVVELGTHNGVSYAAFCSSVVAEGLNCCCAAVDTWRGDHHAGEYGEEVYQDLKAWHDPRFGSFSTLIRSTFDEAAPGIADGSVDLLHIDGLHTYEAVRHDFETWLPKLSRQGIVLLHDTEERSGDFGVWRLWAELRERYPSFGFRHSHGLGLLVTGPDAPDAILDLCAIREPESAARLEAVFATSGRRWAAEGELVFEWARAAELRETASRESEAAAHARAEAAREREQTEATRGERDAARAEAAREREQTEVMRGERDAARLEVSRLESALERGRLETQRAQAEAQAAVARAEEITNSTTWRVTHPLRVALVRTPALRRVARALIRPSLHAARATLRAIRRKGGDARRKVLRSGLFDVQHYLAANPDVAAAGIDPIEHYLHYGWRERRDPGPGFSTRGYLNRYEDVRAAGINPLVHYVLYGQREGRLIVMPAGEVVQRLPRRSRPRKVLDLLGAILRKPSLGVGLARDSQRFGPRRAAAAMWEAVAAPGPIPQPAPPATLDRDAWLAQTFRIVPYYLNPHLQQDPPVPPLRLAVHLHLYYEEMTGQCIGYLRNIPAHFDLYVSVPEGRDSAALARHLAAALPEAGEVQVEVVPNRGRDIAPLIVQFGERLLRYDAIAHFHTKKSPHDTELAGWFESIMGTLCGTRSGVAQILDLLGRDAKMVYPAGNKRRLWDDSGWSGNRLIAERILREQGLGNTGDFRYVEFPEGAMFWARTGSLARLLRLPLGFEDFPEEPIAPDATFAHALERLILVLAQAEPGRNYRLESPDLSREPGEYFEAQHDFSQEIVHDTVKVLAYYLPQFHPTPENSAWHGEGFTEWHKVRAAYPLFQGHYQQHVPHPDIGYYHLDSPEQLQKQAEMMRKAGVHGMIFYHYWFSGRLILEKPAQMLLAHLEVDMPFCFCWANENWTRRWDGNEREILLGQVYSPQDAAEFIRYLIPFFRDDRYIKVEGRPVLFVYRPASIEGARDYVDIWRRECEAAGLPAPYLVAVLTRGAASPHDYGMDAGAERVLHDWLGSAAREIRGELRPYWPTNGSVLDYREVAEHYTRKALARDFPLFRSLVPVWDNTARYASEALLLHNFTTEAMQRWIEHLIRDAEEYLPPDRRFVVVNAWNEWAEGAHLEPDLRFGYGYLNAIGRALCGYPFDALDYIRIEQTPTLALVLEEHAARRLGAEEEARRKFVHCLASSDILARCRLRVADERLAEALRGRGLVCEVGEAEEPGFTLVFGDLFLFPETSLERMMQMALRHQGHAICGSPLNDPKFLHDPAAAAGQIPYSGRTGMELLPHGEPRGYKVCAEASVFRMGEQVAAGARVSTVIRYHGRGQRKLLMHAMLCLLAQGSCRVRPCIGVQDLPEPAATELQCALEALPWAEDCRPVIRFFQSTPEAPDLRSAMLNEMLRAAGPDYVAFLDYDDIVFPHAYETLLSRLKATGKNATFARVYSTTVDHGRSHVLRREIVYDYGCSYDDFFSTNHAPLHSFMLDMRQVDASAVQYFPDMKFMEDYYLTLQIFSREDTDWESLAQEIYVGDYIHIQGHDANTLAITNAEKRRELLLSAEYRLSEARINELRRRIA